jgi:uncharacterized membrane protein YbjE (DUF340 family)
VKRIVNYLREDLDGILDFLTTWCWVLIGIAFGYVYCEIGWSIEKTINVIFVLYCIVLLLGRLLGKIVDRVIVWWLKNHSRREAE